MQSLFDLGMQVEGGLEQDSAHLHDYSPLVSIHEGLEDHITAQQKDETQALPLNGLQEDELAI